MGEKKEFLTPSDVCDRVGISKNTLLRWERDGLIPKAKVDWRGWRRYTEEDLRKIMKAKDLRTKENLARRGKK